MEIITNTTYEVGFIALRTIASSPPRRFMMRYRFDTSNLHNNDKFVEAINDFKLQIQQLKGVMEQNKTAIANLETVCQSSSNDTAYIELHTLRKEYELICSENAILKIENAEYLERMNNLVYITSDLNTKIKILEEEKASLVTSVRLVNEDKRQLIMEAKRLGKVYEPEPSSEVSNQTTHCESIQNENPMQNEQHNKIIELVELDKTFQEPNGPNTRNENMNHVVGAAVSGHPDRTSTVKQPNSVCASQIPKSVVPCPFLLRRGHCTKGVNCDFSHSNLESNNKEHKIFSKPKHLTPCPFLERKESCLKGEKCDFFHKTTLFQQRHHPNYYENPAFLEPLENIMSILRQVEVGLQKFNITHGTGFQQIPTPMGLNRCPPTAMPQNRQLLRPLMSIPSPYF